MLLLLFTSSRSKQWKKDEKIRQNTNMLLPLPDPAQAVSDVCELFSLAPLGGRGEQVPCFPQRANLRLNLFVKGGEKGSEVPGPPVWRSSSESQRSHSDFGRSTCPVKRRGGTCVRTTPRSRRGFSLRVCIPLLPAELFFIKSALESRNKYTTLTQQPITPWECIYQRQPRLLCFPHYHRG